jgi:hypothetical protein
MVKVKSKKSSNFEFNNIFKKSNIYSGHKIKIEYNYYKIKKFTNPSSTNRIVEIVSLDVIIGLHTIHADKFGISTPIFPF